VVVADASARDFDEYGSPRDVFGYIAAGVRMAQQSPESEVVRDYCDDGGYVPGPTAQESLAGGVPSWFLGLTIQALLGAGALVGAWGATRAPSGRMGRESRIA
jgi:ABC-2 type transport system permease protein